MARLVRRRGASCAEEKSNPEGNSAGCTTARSAKDGAGISPVAGSATASARLWSRSGSPKERRCDMDSMLELSIGTVGTSLTRKRTRF